MRRLEGRREDGRRRNEHTATELENEPILSKLGLYSAGNSLNRPRSHVGDRNHDLQKPNVAYFRSRQRCKEWNEVKLTATFIKGKAAGQLAKILFTEIVC